MKNREIINRILVFFIGLLVLIPNTNLHGQYKIEGYIQLDEKWQNRIFFSALDEWDDIYSISESMVIKESIIDEKGYFSFSGDELADTYGIYRLHIIKNSQPVAFLMRNHKYSNCINFIFSNRDSISLSCPSTEKLFNACDIESSYSENKDFFELNKKMETFYMNIDSSKTSRLKSIYKEKFETFIKNYIDRSNSPLGNLLALQAFDMTKKNNKGYVEKILSSLDNPKFLNKYHQSLKGHYFAANQSNKSNSEYSNLLLWLSLTANLLLSFFLWKLWSENRNLKHLSQQKPKVETRQFSRKQLTKKENEVLELILLGNTNQEIADQLYVGLSTIKTHINNLYRKTGINDRKELLKAFGKKNA